MLSLDSSLLKDHLESQHGFSVIGLVDLDWLSGQPRRTLFSLFKTWHKPCFDANERVVLFNRRPISQEMLIYIQKCVSKIDISNFFILLCSADADLATLEKIRKEYSTDDHIFSTLDISFTDQILDDQMANPMITLPESFCFSPWAHFEISSTGTFKPCCVYREPITRPDGKAYNINENSIEEVYNSDYLVDLRKQFRSGQRPQNCSNCWYKEQSGGKSNRHWLMDHLGLHADLLDIEQDRSIDNLISLDIKMGNVCNFKCRICDEYNSSKIADEKAKYSKLTIDLKTLNANGRWANNEKIWEMFERVGDNLVNIDFYGGEPFLVKQHEIFLDYLIDKKVSSKIRLHYNSNGSIYPSNLFAKWKHFREIDIAFSIDNIGSKFELERGGDWDEVNDNLDRFLQSRPTNMILSIFTTVNVQNVFDLGNLADWVESKQFNSWILNILQIPRYMSIIAMGRELTDLAITRLTQIDNGLLLKYNIFPIIEMLQKNRNTAPLTEELSAYMKQLDDIRGQDFSQTHPDIARIIYKGKENGQTI